MSEWEVFYLELSDKDQEEITLEPGTYILLYRLPIKPTSTFYVGNWKTRSRPEMIWGWMEWRLGLLYNRVKRFLCKLRIYDSS